MSTSGYGDGFSWVRGSMLGKGGFGSVYLATLKNPGSKYSFFPPEMAVKSAELSTSNSIKHEREIYDKIKGCRDIIECFGEETTRGDNGVMAYNMLLEYGSGGTLAARIKKSNGRGLPEIEAKMYTRSILRGLNHIHESGYVHCDMKPDNILLVPRSGSITEFRAKIGDLGLAKRAKPKRAKPSKKRKLSVYLRGTPMYLSPEAVTDGVQEAPSDVWALGCIVFEMLTGKPIWDEKLDTQEVIKKIRAKKEFPKIPGELSKEANDFLKCCFNRRPMYRMCCEMLLDQPFLRGLENDDEEDDDNGEEEVEEDNDFHEFEYVGLKSNGCELISRNSFSFHNNIICI